MKIALFSDIHGNVMALKAVFAAIEALGGADLKIAAGDLIGGDSGTDEIIELLEAHGVLSVKGDSDTQEKLTGLEASTRANPGSTRSSAEEYQAMRLWIEQNLSAEGRVYLDALPLSRTFEVAPGRRLFVCHASPRSVGDRVCAPFCDVATFREAFASVDAEVVAYGHAHEPHVRFLDGKLYVNVAAVGVKRFGLTQFTLLKFQEGHWLVAQHTIPFDHTSQVELTRQCGLVYDPDFLHLTVESQQEIIRRYS